jgi:hypothetical protein
VDLKLFVALNDLLRDTLRVDGSPDLASIKKYDANERFDNSPADCFHVASSVELNRPAAFNNRQLAAITPIGESRP